jgi:hypothetical protein
MLRDSPKVAWCSPSALDQGCLGQHRRGHRAGLVTGSQATFREPYAARNSSPLIEIDGTPIPATRDSRLFPARAVSPEYFVALNIPMTRGRVFTRDDVSGAMLVVPTVISEAMALQYWPGQDPIGHRFREPSAIHEVIGVSRDVQSVTFMTDDGPLYCSPIDSTRSRPAYLLVRVAGDPQATATILRDIVRQMDPQMASTVATLDSTLDLYRRLAPAIRSRTVSNG